MSDVNTPEVQLNESGSNDSVSVGGGAFANLKDSTKVNKAEVGADDSSPKEESFATEEDSPRKKGVGFAADEKTSDDAPARPTVPRGYSYSQRVVKDGSTWNRVVRLWQKMNVGGSVFDGFLLAASQEVGQAILALPFVFGQLGFAGGVFFEFFFATLALYTCALLVSMHAQFRWILKATDDPRHSDDHYIVSYYEIMEHFVGKWLKYFSMTVVFFSLIGLSTVQIIAAASNMYLIYDGYSKRTWAIILGCCFSAIAFVPTFRHFRLLSILGVLTTTYVAWYMTVTSIVIGKSEDTTYSAPQSIDQFMLGVVALLFTYGGHTSNIEVADVMDNPADYDRSYFWSYLYVFTLTMPNAVAAYYAFGDEVLGAANSFALFPKTTARDVGMMLMMLHELVAFGLFAGPLFHMWEKLLRISHRPFLFRAVLRLPVCGVMLFLAVLFPFFGAINAILGAFTTSFGTYIIPAYSFNRAFKPGSEDVMIKKPYFNLKLMRVINWLIVIVVGVIGVGYGGYVAIKNFVEQFSQYELFAECYQCGSSYYNGKNQPFGQNNGDELDVESFEG